MVYALLQQLNPGAEERMVGYHAICLTVVVRDDIPRSLQRGVLRTAPAWLLAKLALDKSLRGGNDHQWGVDVARRIYMWVTGPGVCWCLSPLPRR
jgi:hypothetical protein